MSTFYILLILLVRPFSAQECDEAKFMQLQSSSLQVAGVEAPPVETVEQVEYRLADADGLHLFESHPSLLQKRGQSHLGDASTSGLRLRFSAHGHDLDLAFEKQRAPISRDAMVTLGTADGLSTFHFRERHIYVHPRAILTSVGGTLRGTVRHGEVFMDLELPRGASLLTVRTGRREADYLQEARPLELPEKWTDCYQGDHLVHALGMGVAIGSKLFSSFKNKDEAIDYVIQIFSSANLIYRPQLNFVLVCRKLHLQESHEKSPSWDQGPNCQHTIDKQLHLFDDWDPPGSEDKETSQGLWTLLDDCFKSGTIGLAYVGTICKSEKNYWGQRANVAVVWHSFRTWITFAHEVGHNFGGDHSFELGQGTTGGIMDYGDGELDGKFQFNTQFRKVEMCKVMDKAVRDQCSAIWHFDGKCGNGILTDDEECECHDGSTKCAFCQNCMLEKNASCTPEGYGVRPIGLGVGVKDCCNEHGFFQQPGSLCHVPGVGAGYCTAGLCIPSKCSDYHFVGDFCGLQVDNDCKFMCLDKNKGCSKMDGWLVRSQPANYVRDQVPCTWKRPGDGICMKGSCVPAVEGCGNGLKEEDEDCECKDGSRKCHFCSDCTLDRGKECSPDDEDGMCCNEDGTFRSGDCTKGNAKGYCLKGICQDTPCSNYKAWNGWGDYCGLHPDTSCKFMCTLHGKCDPLERWVLKGQPLNQFADGTPCRQHGGAYGSCKQGICEVVKEVKEKITGSSEDVDLQPGEEGDVSSTSEGGEANVTQVKETSTSSASNVSTTTTSSTSSTSTGTCAACMNGANCNIIRARSEFSLSCKDIERDYKCDCSHCSACEEQKSNVKPKGCPQTCGGFLWWAKSCDTHVWNSRFKDDAGQGQSRWTCGRLEDHWNCDCDGCLLCEKEYDVARSMRYVS